MQHAFLSKATGLLLLLCLSIPATAQSNRYRAEFLLLERIQSDDPILLQMAHKPLPAPIPSAFPDGLPDQGTRVFTDQVSTPTLPSADLPASDDLSDPTNPVDLTNPADPTTSGSAANLQKLWVTDPIGLLPVASDLPLLAGNSLTLNEVAGHLARSNNYRVLLTSGWTGEFAPGYASQPMVIGLGEAIGNHRQIEGTIRISRGQYLLVDAQITQFKASTQAEATVAPTDPLTATLASETRQPEVVSWIREERQMKSKEFHYLDSSGIGLIVYFEPIAATAEDSAAAPQDAAPEAQQDIQPEIETGTETDAISD